MLCQAYGSITGGGYNIVIARHLELLADDVIDGHTYMTLFQLLGPITCSSMGILIRIGDTELYWTIDARHPLVYTPD